ncbi:MAG: adenylate/guanylate cyclase domain-containing protein [Sciscionella sp.]
MRTMVWQAKETVRRADRHPRLLALAGWLRDRLPGDAGYGDPLSLGERTPVGLIGQRLTSVAATHPSALRELGLGALQVWQAHASSYPQEVGNQELAVLFTDLAGFSDLTLQAGDDVAVEILREVGSAIEPLIKRRGRLVKRLGDGVMAVFSDVDAAVTAAIAAKEAVDEIDVRGYRLRLRAGVHVGKPRRLGEDYFGRDVNIAARVAAAAGGGEVLISSPTRERLENPELRLRRRLRFKAKGVPDDIHVYAVTSE